MKKFAIIALLVLLVLIVIAVYVSKYELSKEISSEQQLPAKSEIATESIGIATMTDDGTIVLDLRAQAAGGAIGDARLTYPKTHQDYQNILDHLGSLRPGEQKSVPPWSDSESPPDQIALRLAWEAVMKTDRYKSWKAKGVEYQATTRPTYPKSDVKYKTELWTIDFNLPSISDQNMYVDVNINTQKVIYLHEYGG